MHKTMQRHAHHLASICGPQMGLCEADWAHLEALLDDIQRVVGAALHVLLALRRRVQGRHPNLHGCRPQHQSQPYHEHVHNLCYACKRGPAKTVMKPGADSHEGQNCRTGRTVRICWPKPDTGMTGHSATVTVSLPASLTGREFWLCRAAGHGVCLGAGHRFTHLRLARPLRDVDVRHIVVLAAVRADAATQALGDQDLRGSNTTLSF